MNNLSTTIISDDIEVDGTEHSGYLYPDDEFLKRVKLNSSKQQSAKEVKTITGKNEILSSIIEPAFLQSLVQKRVKQEFQDEFEKEFNRIYDSEIKSVEFAKNFEMEDLIMRTQEPTSDRVKRWAKVLSNIKIFDMKAIFEAMVLSNDLKALKLKCKNKKSEVGPNGKPVKFLLEGQIALSVWVMPKSLLNLRLEDVACFHVLKSLLPVLIDLLTCIYMMQKGQKWKSLFEKRPMKKANTSQVPMNSLNSFSASSNKKQEAAEPLLIDISEKQKEQILEPLELGPREMNSISIKHEKQWAKFIYSNLQTSDQMSAIIRLSSKITTSSEEFIRQVLGILKIPVQAFSVIIQQNTHTLSIDNKKVLKVSSSLPMPDFIMSFVLVWICLVDSYDILVNYQRGINSISLKKRPPMVGSYSYIKETPTKPSDGKSQIFENCTEISMQKPENVSVESLKNQIINRMLDNDKFDKLPKEHIQKCLSSQIAFRLQEKTPTSTIFVCQTEPETDEELAPLFTIYSSEYLKNVLLRASPQRVLVTLNKYMKNSDLNSTLTEVYGKLWRQKPTIVKSTEFYKVPYNNYMIELRFSDVGFNKSEEDQPFVSLFCREKSWKNVNKKFQEIIVEALVRIYSIERSQAFGQIYEH